MLNKLFGKKKNKKTKLKHLNGQEFIDAYNKQLEETGKATLAEKAKFTKISAKQREDAYRQGGE